jgi:hypothetical protein
MAVAVVESTESHLAAERKYNPNMSKYPKKENENCARNLKLPGKSPSSLTKVIANCRLGVKI